MKLRFSIRDLLWLTALSAVLAAWWTDHSRQAKRIEDLSRPVNFLFPGTATSR